MKKQAVHYSAYTNKKGTVVQLVLYSLDVSPVLAFKNPGKCLKNARRAISKIRETIF